MQHIIRKQIWDVLIDGSLDAFRIQQVLSGRNRESIIPLLEKEFDRLSSDDEVISFDRLEIDLGNISESQLNKPEWGQELIARIREQIESLGIPSGGHNRSTAAVRHTPALSRYRQWLFYMQHGYLPWNALRTDPQWQTSVLGQLAVDYAAISELRREIVQNPRVLARIARQHSQPLLIQLVEILTACKQAELAGVFHEWQQLAAVGYDPVHTGTSAARIWEAILRQAVTAPAGTTATELVVQSWKQATGPVAAISEEKRVLLDELLQSAHGLVHLLPLLREEQRKAWKTKGPQQTDKQSAGKKARAGKEHTEPGAQLREPDASPEASGNANPGTAGDVPEEGLFVPHAGLVLLHPFLPHLLRHCGLVEGKSFVSDAAKEQALHLFHYAATGTVPAEEHDLVIAKLLCSYPLEEPVTAIQTLPAAMLEETDNMLHAVIAQWSILKNTSPAGLREGFLQRNGKVFRRNEKNYIQVEHTAIDVLLDQLPWNLSMVRMPWMDAFLMVEWR